MAGDNAGSRDRFPLFSLMVGLVGFSAATVEILNYFEVKPKNLVTYASLALTNGQAVTASPAPTPAVATPSPVLRPARLVLIVKNSGDKEAMSQVLQLASRTAAQFVPADSVSLITFVNGRHVWVFRDVPGDQARTEIDGRLEGLFSVEKVTVKAAVDDALKRLTIEPESEKNSAVVVLSGGIDDRTLGRWIEQVRRDHAARGLVLGAGDNSSDDAK